MYQVPIVVSNFSLMQDYPGNKNKGSFVVCTLKWYVLCFITPKIHDWNALSSIHNETYCPQTIFSMKEGFVLIVVVLTLHMCLRFLHNKV